MATWIARILCALSLGLAGIGLFLLVLSREALPRMPVFEEWVEDAVVAVGFSTLGALVAPASPRNPIGGSSAPLDSWRRYYCSRRVRAYSLLARPGSLPGGEAMAWVASWLWVAHSGLFAFLGLLFPDGRLPTPRWRPFAWLVGAVVVAG